MKKILIPLLLLFTSFTWGQNPVQKSDILVQAYSKTLNGTQFWYHSALPDVHNALLVRAIDGSQIAEWETEPVPETNHGQFINFIWQAGLGANMGSARMDLFLNDQKIFSFYTEQRHNWDYADQGMEFSYRNAFVDGAGDYFGFMFLRIPSDMLEPGQPQKLKVVGSKSNSQAWFMCFEEAIPTGLTFTTFPGVMRKNNKLVQPVSIQVVYFGQAAKGTLSINGNKVRDLDLDFGIQTFYMDFPVVSEDTEILVGLESPKISQQQKVVLHPPRKWRVNFVQHTHTDIGYTRPQTEILGEHLRFIDYALDYCDATDDYPEEAQFRWTCEAAFAVDDYLRCRPAQQIDRLKRRVKEDRIEITGMYFNFDEMPDEQSYAASLQSIRRIKEAGIPVKTAMQNDVNGIGWCFADYFPPLGVKYLNMGTHGHRALIPFDKPTAFWWESPSGNRMLAFRAEHYMTGNTVFGIHSQNFSYFEEKLMLYLKDLEQKEYPYDIIHIQHSGYLTDNAPPSILSSDMIRQWNEKYEWPKLRTAIVSEFFEEIEETHGNELPVVRGAWPDWWTDGFASGAREGAVSRQSHVDLIAYQGALSMARLMGSELPEGINQRIDAVNQALLFYDEHTFGFSESVRSPFSAGTMEQRALKESYAWEAFRRARQLGEEALGLLQCYISRENVPTLAVFNTLNWDRSGLVEIYIDHQMLPLGKNFKITDSLGNEAKAQATGHRSDGTYWNIWVEDVPAFGYKKYTINVDDDLLIHDAQGQQAAGNAKINLNENSGILYLENQWYKLQIDKGSASIISLFDKNLSMELIDKKASVKLGEFILEKLGNRSEMEAYTLKTYERKPLDSVWFEASEEGELWNTIRFKGDSETLIGPAGFELEIRLFNTAKRIDLAYMVRKKPIIEPESFYLAFPFFLENGQIYCEVQGGVMKAGIDQIPGSSNDWNTVQNFASIHNGKAQIVLSSHEIPLMQFGGINTGRYRADAKPESTHIYGWPMNNYWVTNFNADQRGEFSFTYSITSGVDQGTQSSSRFGWGKRIPMPGRVLPAGKRTEFPDINSLLQIHPDNLLLISAQPEKNSGSIILHLREIGGTKASLSIEDRLGVSLTIQETNVVGENISPEDTEIKFEPWEVKFIRIRIEE